MQLYCILLAVQLLANIKKKNAAYSTNAY
jgi:hypothetical protein